MVLDFRANRLEGKFLRETGAVDDHFTIVKGAAPLRITPAGVSGGTARLSWNSIADRAYRVEFSPVLPAMAWTNLSGLIRATDVTTSWSGLVNGGFYRVWSAND
jgi:hypothetical protein